MMLKIEIEMEGSAFEDDMRDGELRLIMADIRRRIKYGNESGLIRDLEGNLCGEWSIE